MKKSKTRFAVLGILSYGAMSGYDIKKFYEQNVAGFWSESYGQIYPILKRLAEERLATRSVQKQEGKPDRHIYAITDKGRKELQQWLVEPTGRHIGRHETLLKLMFGQQISIGDNIAQIKRFRQRQIDELKEIEALKEHFEHQEDDNPNLPFWRLAFGYGEHVNRAYINWAEEAIAALREMQNKKPSRN
ncbi:MAG: PadR family transcriptional regulator [Desulfobacterales bacterium]|jgi:PadR family transcriptional regulator AphA